MACEKGSINFVQTLMQEYNATNAKNDKNNTPLHIAALNSKDEVVLALINEFGCDTSIKGFNGWSLLHILHVKVVVSV